MAKEEKNYLEYKGKPFIRRGNVLYFGDPKERFMVKFVVNSTAELNGNDIADSVTVQLVTNACTEKERVIKQAERDGLYRAFDVGEYWLTDALEATKG